MQKTHQRKCNKNKKKKIKIIKNFLFRSDKTQTGQNFLRVDSQRHSKKSNSSFSGEKNSVTDVDKIFARKVDLDYIPGLDDEVKVFLPCNLDKNKDI